jgi:hypothetical protein
MTLECLVLAFANQARDLLIIREATNQQQLTNPDLVKFQIYELLDF